MFARLLSHPGVREELVLRSRFGFMAFHGGSLERHTDAIARRAAKAADASCYTVVQPPEFRWHVPSKAIDPAQSERLASFLDHVDVVVAVHGFGRQPLFTSILVGGSNRRLAAATGVALRRDVPHYRVLDDLDDIPKDLRGLHPDNPVNRPRQGGVQLELCPRVRGMGPYWEGWPGGPNPHTSALVDALASIAAAWATEPSGSTQ